MFKLSLSKLNKFLTLCSIAFGARFGDQILHDFMSLPLPSLILSFVTVTSALAVSAVVLVFGIKNQRYLAAYRSLLRKLYDYLWSFTIAGLGTAFVVLATSLAPFWMLWGTWAALGLFGLILFDVWLMREPLNMRAVGDWVFKRFGVRLEQATDTVIP